MIEEVYAGVVGGGEVDLPEADGGPHGLDAAGGEAVEPAVLDLGNEAMAAEFSDQA
jgi:hypothetical protein